MKEVSLNDLSNRVNIGEVTITKPKQTEVRLHCGSGQFDLVLHLLSAAYCARNLPTDLLLIPFLMSFYFINALLGPSSCLEHA